MLNRHSYIAKCAAAGNCFVEGEKIDSINIYQAGLPGHIFSESSSLDGLLARRGIPDPRYLAIHSGSV